MVPGVSGLDAERIIRRNTKKKKVNSLFRQTSGCKVTTSIKESFSENGTLDLLKIWKQLSVVMRKAGLNINSRCYR